jgi:hypothetical protein
MKFDNQETATILAALRNWQEICSDEGGNDPREVSPEHFDEADPLDGSAIDALCERINCAPDDAPLTAAAPAMLAALKDAMAHVALLATGQRPPDSNAEMVDRLGSVIDSAEGR